MKKYTIILLFLLSCSDDKINKPNINPNPFKTEVYYINGRIIQIVYYKNHEYLMYDNGGVVHSESCQCNKNKDSIINDLQFKLKSFKHSFDSTLDYNEKEMNRIEKYFKQWDEIPAQ